MGGGAAITWELELESFPLKLNRAGEFAPARKPVIDRWHASDYMNAMSNIRPNLLRLVSVTISDPNREWITRPDWGGDYPYARMNGQKLQASSYSGYMRREPWYATFPLTFTGRMYVDYYGDLDVTAVATYRNKRQFDLFYRRLFECYTFQPSEATMDRKYGGLRGWYDWQWSRMEDWYVLR